jgi:hypothetical protein
MNSWAAGRAGWPMPLTDGGTEDLAEVSLLCFSADGLVLEHRDFWVQG